ncbi:Fic family protein [Pseudolactococcus yaeyamensis]
MRDLPEDYIKDLAIRFSHHSTALEGNTLTLAETALLLLEGMTPNRRVHKREIFEIESNARALNVVLQEVNEPNELTEFIIKKIHYFIGESTVTFAGEYKKLDNYIVGADFQTVKASEVAATMAEFVSDYNKALKETSHLFETIADYHIRFEKIHPFSDGNGRTGRMLNALVALKHDRLVPVIPSDEKGRYLQYLKDEDSKGLGEWLETLSEFEVERYDAFAYVASQEIKDFSQPLPKNRKKAIEFGDDELEM